MTENDQRNQSNTLLGTHAWQLQSKKNFLLGTDVWQLQVDEITALKKLLPSNNKLDKIIQIAQILDKYQREIDYYQTRIRKLLGVLGRKELKLEN